MFVVLTHGGAGSDPTHRDGPAHAAREGVKKLVAGGLPLDAVCVAVEILEDDPRFNAGTGSSLREDGQSVEMDASCMDSDGHYGSVCGLQRVQYPIRVARAVMRTRHIAIGGVGANRFARELGCADYDPVTAEARARFRERRETSKDTVGAVATDGKRFAAALSTGGIQGAMIGRIGDVPFPGCGLFAGPRGAVAATGAGEEIARRVLAYEVYHRIAAGEPPEAVVPEVISRFPAEHDLGLIAVNVKGAAGASNRRMAWADARS